MGPTVYLGVYFSLIQIDINIIASNKNKIVGREEGRTEGRTEGREEGRKERRKKGLNGGRTEGQ